MKEKSNPYHTDYSFPKKEKLKSKKTIEELFLVGKNIREFPIKLIYLKSDFDDGAKIKAGVVAPKKKFKRAVDRNRIKRLLREAYRLNKPLIFNNIERTYAFLFLYLGNKDADFQDVDSAMKKIMETFLKKESNEANDQ